MPKQQYQIYCGQTGIHNSQLELFKTFCTSGVSFTKKSTPYYPQSNEKAEATVKATKKILRAAWTGQVLDKLVLWYAKRPSYNIVTHHQQEMGPKSCMDTSYKTPFPYNSGCCHHSGNTAGRKQNNALSNHKLRGSSSKVQFYGQQSARRHHCGNAYGHSEYYRTKSWDTYGMLISLHRQYHVCTTGYIWNHYIFLRGVNRSLPPGEIWSVAHRQSRYRVRTLKRHNQSRGDQLVRANLSPDYWKTHHGHTYISTGVKLII